MGATDAGRERIRIERRVAVRELVRGSEAGTIAAQSSHLVRSTQRRSDFDREKTFGFTVFRLVVVRLSSTCHAVFPVAGNWVTCCFTETGDPQSVREQIEGAIRIGENLIAYATGRELKDKLEQRFVLEGAAARRDASRCDSVGDAGSGCRRARSASGLAQRGGADRRSRADHYFIAAAKPVGFDAEQLTNVPFLWIHGRTDFSFDDGQRQVLREYVESGGVILGSAVCGSEAFADAFRREIALVLPDAPLRALPAGSPCAERLRRF